LTTGHGGKNQAKNKERWTFKGMNMETNVLPYYLAKVQVMANKEFSRC
jgi:hypothetical protein